MTAKERRKVMIEILCQKRHETRSNLASEFGVTTRTIDYDIVLLSMEYPIYTVQGPSGGIFVAEGFELGRFYLPDKYISVLENMRRKSQGEELEAVEYILKKFKKPEGRKR
ncbi:MAG: HTH domain-containing protein [Lachnospiraceae bacterium]|nr:HTH domain-containing protein [Lachnospiraceae bacterium]